MDNNKSPHNKPIPVSNGTIATFTVSSGNETRPIRFALYCNIEEPEEIPPENGVELPPPPPSLGSVLPTLPGLFTCCILVGQI